MAFVKKKTKIFSFDGNTKDLYWDYWFSTILTISLVVGFVSLKLSVFGIIAFTSSWLLYIYGHREARTRIVRNYKNTILLGLLFVLALIGISNTSHENIHIGFRSIEAQFGLFLFPLVLSALPINKPFILRIIKGSFVGLLVYIVFVLLINFQDSNNASFFLSIIDILKREVHRTYLSLYLVFFSSVLTVHYFNKGKTIQKIKGLSILITSLAVILLVESRIALVAFVILTLFFLRLLKNKYHKVVLLLFSLGFLLVFSFAIMPNTSRGKIFIEKYKKVFNHDEHYKPYHFDHRLGVWESATDVFLNNFLFGVGTGDLSQELVMACKKDKLPKSLHFTDPHNQYFNVLLKHGVLGFVFWSFSLGVFIFNAIKTKYLYYQLFLVTILVYFTIESILIRQIGVVFYAIFNSLFYIEIINNKTIENK